MYRDSPGQIAKSQLNNMSFSGKASRQADRRFPDRWMGLGVDQYQHITGTQNLLTPQLGLPVLVQPLLFTSVQNAKKVDKTSNL